MKKIFGLFLLFVVFFGFSLPDKIKEDTIEDLNNIASTRAVLKNLTQKQAGNYDLDTNAIKQESKKLADMSEKTTKKWRTYGADYINSEEFLSLSADDGITPALVFALYDRAWKTNNINILKLQDDNKTSVAHALASVKNDWTTDNIDILKLRDKQGVSVAHVLAGNKVWSTQNQDILKIKDSDNITVAHILARKNMDWQTQDESILKLTDNAGNTVAHDLLKNNKQWEPGDFAILKLKDNKGKTIAHYLAQNNLNWTSSSKEVLMLKDNDNNSVAHILAKKQRNWSTDDEDILKLTNNSGTAVAHILAENNVNWQTDNKNILLMKEQDGNTVAHYLALKNRAWNTEDEQILNTTNNAGISVGSLLANRNLVVKKVDVPVLPVEEKKEEPALKEKEQEIINKNKYKQSSYPNTIFIYGGATTSNKQSIYLSDNDYSLSSDPEGNNNSAYNIGIAFHVPDFGGLSFEYYNIKEDATLVRYPGYDYAQYNSINTKLELVFINLEIDLLEGEGGRFYIYGGTGLSNTSLEINSPLLLNNKVENATGVPYQFGVGLDIAILSHFGVYAKGAYINVGNIHFIDSEPFKIDLKKKNGLYGTVGLTIRF
jgi:predicted transcriptional regulator